MSNKHTCGPLHWKSACPKNPYAYDVHYFGALLSPQWSVVLLAQWIHAWSYSIHVVWCIMHVFPAWLLPCPSSGLPCSSDCSKSLMVTASAQTCRRKKRDRDGGKLFLSKNIFNTILRILFINKQTDFSSLLINNFDKTIPKKKNVVLELS
jgi:hypothetical protein